VVVHRSPGVCTQVAPPVAASRRTDLEAELQRTARVAAFLAQDAVALSEELKGLQATLGLGRDRFHAHGAALLVPQGKQLVSARPSAFVPRGGRFSPLRASLLSSRAYGGLRDEPAALAAEMGTMAADVPTEAAPASPDSAALGAEPPPPPASEGGGDAAAQTAAAEPATSEASTTTVATATSLPSNTTLGGSTEKRSDGPKCGGSEQPECSTFMRVLTMDYHFTVFWSCVHWSVIFFVLFVICWCCSCCGGSRSRY